MIPTTTGRWQVTILNNLIAFAWGPDQSGKDCAVFLNVDQAKEVIKVLTKAIETLENKTS